jgi:hypothetical protein
MEQSFSNPLTKNCRRCKTDKPFSDFSKDKSRKDGLAHWCRNCNAQKMATYISVPQNKIRLRHYNSSWIKARNQKLLDKVLDHYGRKCSCPKCPDPTPNSLFLTIDHKIGNGRKDRREKKSGGSFYRWIINNNFPDYLQILCWNCNCGRYRNGGICPHILS